MGVRKNCVAVNKRSPLWRPVAPRVAAVGLGENVDTSIATIRMTLKVKEQLQQRAQDANMTLTDYLFICGLGGYPKAHHLHLSQRSQVPGQQPPR